MGSTRSGSEVSVILSVCIRVQHINSAAWSLVGVGNIRLCLHLRARVTSHCQVLAHFPKTQVALINFSVLYLTVSQT